MSIMTPVEYIFIGTVVIEFAALFIGIAIYAAVTVWREG